MGEVTMSIRKPWVGMAVLVLIGGGMAAARSQDAKAVPQTLNDQTFQRWREYIHPSAAETTWESSGWQTSVWAGLTLAQEKKMPLLFWTMTGHPCGMT